MIDSKGLLWMGTNEGVANFESVVFINFDIPKTEDKDSNTIYSLNRITGIVEDKNGHMRFGTDGFGLTKYVGKLFVHYTVEDGLVDNTIHELMIDSKGNIWIGTF